MLIEKLIPRLCARGLRMSLIKHAHHMFGADRPANESYRHRVAGCAEIPAGCRRCRAPTKELRGAPEPSRDELLGQASPSDLVLVEGFRREPVPKIEVE